MKDQRDSLVSSDRRAKQFRTLTHHAITSSLTIVFILIDIFNTSPVLGVEGTLHTLSGSILVQHVYSEVIASVINT